MTNKHCDGQTERELNISFVVGTMATEPEERTLPSGTRVVSFSLTVRAVGERTTSVPMTWFDPPKRLQRLSIGDRVVACGSVVRRFYRSGGGLGSATEVVVTDAAKADSAAARRVVARVGTAVETLASECVG